MKPYNNKNEGERTLSVAEVIFSVILILFSFQTAFGVSQDGDSIRCCELMTPDDIIAECWDSASVHVKDFALSDLPDEVELILADSTHHYCLPYLGTRNSSFKFRRNRPHRGIDIGLAVGDTVVAAFDGVVRVSMPTSKTGGYGNLIIIRHHNGLETYYGHLSEHLVKSGDIVQAGQPIGLGGNTGNSTGPHLHFETRYKGKAFDPERIFNFKEGSLRTEVFTLKKHYFSINSHYGMTDQQSIAAARMKPRSDAPIYYKVRKGDNLTRIAARQGTTVKNLCKLNNIKNPQKLRAGQRLRVK